MLILLLIIIIIMSFVLLLINKNKESIYFLISSLSLCVVLVAVALFIAKKGGVSWQLEILLYGTSTVRYYFQYFVITIQNLGYLLVIGRYTFPLIFLLMCKDFALSPHVKRLDRYMHLFYLFPIFSIIVSYPSILVQLIDSFHEPFQVFIVNFTYLWCILYILIGLGLCLYEYKSTTILFFKQRFLKKLLFVCSMGMIYLLYCRQDPAQIYLFYNNSYFTSLGLWYLSPTLNIYIYFTAVFLSALFSVIGFYSLVRFAQLEIEETQNEIVYKRKFEATANGSSVFIHSIKNQLIQNKILLADVKAYEGQEIDSKFWENIHLLETTNVLMMKRIEELYNSIKTNSISLIPIKVDTIFLYSIERARKKYPEIKINTMIEKNETILADPNYLSEAIYNLIINGYEACETNPEITLKCHPERLYTMLEIADNGKGLSTHEIAKIFDPFYSSKHSNYNWGMGLCYVQKIISSHFGRIKVESKKGIGTQMFILLPRYDKRN